MRTFDELVTEAEAADVTGWGFGWLDGRATEERPSWGYAGLLADRLSSNVRVGTRTARLPTPAPPDWRSAS